MRVLVACEESQAVTKELRRLGHEAYSCDIQPCSGGHPEWHLQVDAHVYSRYALKSKRDSKTRSKTFPGIARAMALQWAGDAREVKDE